MPVYTVRNKSRLHSSFEHGKLRVGATPPPRKTAGPLVKLLQAAVPKRLFSHFYFLSLATCSMVFVDLIFYDGSLFSSRIQVRFPFCFGFGARSIYCMYVFMYVCVQEPVQQGVKSRNRGRKRVLSWSVVTSHKTKNEPPPRAELYLWRCIYSSNSART